MWLDKVKETFSIMTNVKVKKDWSTLNKGDKLYLMIPYEDNGIIKYEFQESQVINIKEYSSICTIRFKYTINNKRKRINLGINKLKFMLPYLAITKETQWAHNYNPKYGDIIVTFDDNTKLNNIYSSLISDEINKQEQIIEEHKRLLNILKTMQYTKIV